MTQLDHDLATWGWRDENDDDDDDDGEDDKDDDSDAYNVSEKDDEPFRPSVVSGYAMYANTRDRKTLDFGIHFYVLSGLLKFNTRPLDSISFFISFADRVRCN